MKPKYLIELLKKAKSKQEYINLINEYTTGIFEIPEEYIEEYY